MSRLKRKKIALPVNPIFGGIPEKHPAAQAFRDVPIPRGGPYLYFFIPTCGMMGLGVVLIVWLLNHPKEALVAGPLPILSVFLAWLALILNGILLGQRLYRKRLAHEEEIRLGPKKSDETYVGVAYTDGFWILREDMAWDRGYLSASSKGLRFRGQVSEFALPAHAICSVRLETSVKSPHQHVPRVFVDWTSPDGEENTISLDTRPAWYDRRAIRAAEHLSNAIASALQQPAESPLSPTWPPAVRLDRLDLRASMVKIGWRDLVAVPVGIAFGCLAMVGVYVVLEFLPIDEALRQSLWKGFGRFSPQILTMAVLGFFFQRIQAKYKALPAPDGTVFDPLPSAIEEKESPEVVKLQS